MKTLSKLFALSAASVLLLTACGNKTAGQQSSTDSDSIAAAAADTVVAQEVQEQKTYEPGRGDLPIFQLFGPVKECKFMTGNEKSTLSFNEQGQWIKEDGHSLSMKFPGGIKRDKNGRLIEGKLDKLEDLNFTYKYNDAGFVVHIEYNEYMDGGSFEDYEYDAQGYVSVMKEQYTGMDAIDPETEEEVGPTVYKYTIVEKDSYGNWTKRKDQKGNVETRKITYFE